MLSLKETYCKVKPNIAIAELKKIKKIICHEIKILLISYFFVCHRNSTAHFARTDFDKLLD